MKPAIEECSICKTEFVVAERRESGPVCLSCKMKEETQKNKTGSDTKN